MILFTNHTFSFSHSKLIDWDSVQYNQYQRDNDDIHYNIMDLRNIHQNQEHSQMFHWQCVAVIDS